VAASLPVAALGANDLTKTGPGALIVRGAGAVADQVVTGTGALNIAVGELVLARDNVLTDTVGVDLAAGALLTVRRDISDTIGALTGDANSNVALETSARLGVGADTDYPGVITGSGGLDIVADATISGTTNTYTGDTEVLAAGILTLNHANNIGGAGSGRLILRPGAGLVGAQVVIDEDSNFILPNIVVIGNGIDPPAANALRNRGGIAIDVPADTVFEIGGNIDYNQNFISKTGDGELILSNAGFNHQGGGTFVVPQNGVTVGLQIVDGRVRIEDGSAVSFGDITVGLGPAGVTPILNVANGLTLNNAIRFSDQSIFETDLAEANHGEGTAIRPAVEVRRLVRTNTPNDSVYNRVDFLQLPGGVVSTGTRFKLMTASPFRDYAAQNVIPVEAGSTVDRAPFMPYFSGEVLFFETTHDIDVPIFTDPATTRVAPGADYRIVIPVTTTTTLRASTLSLVNLPGSNAPQLTANNEIVITGTAPDLDEGEEDRVLTYRVSVTSTNDPAGNVWGYENRREFTLTVGEGEEENPPVVEGPNWTWAGVAINDDLSAVTGTVTLLVDGDPVGAAVPVTVSVYEGTTEVASDDFTLPAATGSVTFTVDGTYEYDTAYTVRAVSGTAAYDSVASASTTVRKATPATPPDERGSSSSGCDAGFGAFALLAATCAVTLLRKKG
jgi:Synergist-CTERM protein sorting domain-containing protein